MIGTWPELRADTWEELAAGLDEWAADYEQFSDDGFMPPTQGAIRHARSLVRGFIEKTSVSPPRRIVPDGKGGIVIEDIPCVDSLDTLIVAADGDVMEHKSRHVEHWPSEGYW